MFAGSFLSAVIFVVCRFLMKAKSEILLFIFSNGGQDQHPSALVPFPPERFLPFMNVLLAITIFKLREEDKRRVEIKLIIV